MNELKKTVTLIKKTKDQPMLFHMLHSHLAYIVQTKKVIPTEPLDLWSRILLASVESSKISRNSIEIKILQYLKNSRNKTEDDILKLRIILYYLDSRPLNNLNTFILFELMNHHYNASTMTNALIDSILAKSFLSKVFNIRTNKKLAKDAVLQFLRSNSDFSHKRLPIYMYFDLEPPLVSYDEKSNVMKFKIIEALSLYANYTENVEHFKSILPQTEEFLGLFKRFVCRDPDLFSEEKTDFDICKLGLVSENNIDDLKQRLKKAFDESSNKAEFKAQMIEFITNIEYKD